MQHVLIKDCCKTGKRKQYTYHIVSYRIVSCRVVSCRVVSCRVISYRIISLFIQNMLKIHIKNKQTNKYVKGENSQKRDRKRAITQLWGKNASNLPTKRKQQKETYQTYITCPSIPSIIAQICLI